MGELVSLESSYFDNRQFFHNIDIVLRSKITFESMLLDISHKNSIIVSNNGSDIKIDFEPHVLAFVETITQLTKNNKYPTE